MRMSTPAIDLDPREVLEHLRALGYNHITKDQLKQFIKDLKKLIKYDLRRLQAKEETEQENLPRCGITCRSVQDGEKGETVHDRKRVLREKNQAEKPLIETHSKSIAVQTLVPPCDLASSSTGRAISSAPSKLRDSSSVSEASSVSCSTCKAALPCSCSAPNLGRKLARKKENSAPKPVSSFIRIPPSEVRMGKTDPVTLYHYYQSVWSKQNRPGENPHADVRWRIRHKMMAPNVIKTNCETKRENPPWVD
uniref:Hydrolethalus syndrome protein 1 n=1 Tax=Lygus hesperus TaxID=30085 RepID=A0A0A9YX17_LYGHE